MAVCNEGHRRLLELLKAPHITHAAIAREAGVSRQAAWAWANGLAKPGYHARKKLEALGVPADAWDRPPGEARAVHPIVDRADAVELDACRHGTPGFLEWSPIECAAGGW